MHTGRRYTLFQTINWSRGALIGPALWATAVTAVYDLLGWELMAIPWLPLSAVAVAVAFYLGFKNNASYDRLWEARKIYGAIVNASRSWAFSARDMVSASFEGHREVSPEELERHRKTLVHRHVAWMDALRHQLRKIQSWEHKGQMFDMLRTVVPERTEDLRQILSTTLDTGEVEEVLGKINPAAHLLANQSRHLGELREKRLLDGFSHAELQKLLIELMAQQGKAERIKNFPFPRQYATVNFFFAVLFCLLVPFGLLEAFEGQLVWLTVPFSAMVSWVFLTMDRIGDWSENPFEGLANDVPITTMSRGIERDIRQMVGEVELPPPREPVGPMQY